jgi:carbon storage regulator
MLVLRRKPGEAIVLNGVIKVIILDMEFGRVKIGIEAPPDVIIVREELLHDANMPGLLPAQPAPKGGQ